MCIKIYANLDTNWNVPIRAKTEISVKVGKSLVLHIPEIEVSQLGQPLVLHSKIEWFFWVNITMSQLGQPLL